VSGKDGIRVRDGELLRGVLVDELLVQQPLDGSALGSNVTQGVPRRNQLGVVFIDLGLESSERDLSPAVTELVVGWLRCR